jgi:hypothetical protein
LANPSYRGGLHPGATVGDDERALHRHTRERVTASGLDTPMTARPISSELAPLVVGLDFVGGRRGPDLRELAELLPPGCRFSVVTPESAATVEVVARQLVVDGPPDVLVAACAAAPVIEAVAEALGSHPLVVEIDPVLTSIEDVVRELSETAARVGAPPIGLGIDARTLSRRQVEDLVGGWAPAIAATAHLDAESPDVLALLDRYMTWFDFLLLAASASAAEHATSRCAVFSSDAGQRARTAALRDPVVREELRDFLDAEIGPAA